MCATTEHKLKHLQWSMVTTDRAWQSLRAHLSEGMSKPTEAYPFTRILPTHKSGLSRGSRTEVLHGALPTRVQQQLQQQTVHAFAAFAVRALLLLEGPSVGALPGEARQKMKFLHSYVSAPKIWCAL